MLAAADCLDDANPFMLDLNIVSSLSSVYNGVQFFYKPVGGEQVALGVTYTQVSS